MGNRKYSLVSASLLMLAGCGEVIDDARCTVVDNGDQIAATGDRFVVYGMSENAGGLSCVPGVDVDGETCTDIFLGCVATVDSAVNTETTFTIGIENRAVDGDDLVINALAFVAGSDPSWSIPVDISPNVQPLTSLEITIAFTPTTAGPVTGALQIDTNASNGTGTDVIQLRGTGIAP